MNRLDQFKALTEGIPHNRAITFGDLYALAVCLLDDAPSEPAKGRTVWIVLDKEDEPVGNVHIWPNHAVSAVIRADGENASMGPHRVARARLEES